MPRGSTTQFCSAAQEELAAISNLVEKNMLRRGADSSSSQPRHHQQQTECVDLDEMFSFLSEVHDPHAQAQEYITGISQEVDNILQEAEAHEVCQTRTSFVKDEIKNLPFGFPVLNPAVLVKGLSFMG
ncbi:hypothetical protein HPB51_006802 [Rhipicephalus microplus]|uniref:Uncharacterized protein n=1 Tax=Rhipicephalus microplus TaxID=6941 RepID=A0A9J6E7V9_RHIMP|nr:hypothetical protein HPB51_006802 [Rhipicephalus microplus]